MSTISLQIRPSDCDAFGHVNNAIYMSYISHAFVETLRHLESAQHWHPDSEFLWELKKSSIEYRQTAVFNDELQAKMWLEQGDQIRPIFGCEISKKGPVPEDSVQSIVRAQVIWQKLRRSTKEVVALSDSLLARFPRRNGGSSPRSFRLPPDNPDIRRYFWDHRVMRSEVGPSGHVHPQVIYNWLEEGVFDASDQAGWTPERRRQKGWFIFQMRHDTEFFFFPGYGDSIRITSRLVDIRRFRGTWIQEIHLMPREELLVRDYSTGVFVDKEGRPTSPPPEMAKEVQFQ